MQGLESPPAGDANFAAAAALHDFAASEHGPLASPRPSKAEAVHDLRQHMSEAVMHGDLQRLHALIADAELRHLLPPHVGLFLDLHWKREPDTHKAHAELAHALNWAMVLAKDYYGLQKLFAEMDKTVPKGEIRVPLREALGTELAPLADQFAQAPPGAARDQAQKLLRDLLEMI